MLPSLIALLAPARTDWPHHLARSFGPTEVAELVLARTVPDLEARLRTRARWPAVFVDAGVDGADLALLRRLRRAAEVVVVVDRPSAGTAWLGAGADRVIRADEVEATASALLAPSPTGFAPTTAPRGGRADAARGPLIAVIGRGSRWGDHVPAAVSESLARTVRSPRPVVLADLAVDARQGALHGITPRAVSLGVLLDAHGPGWRVPSAIASTRPVPDRGYRVLPGLASPTGWVSIRPATLDAAIDGLCRSASAVVAAIDTDLEGEADTGSHGIEDRNLLARTAVRRAEVIVVVGAAGPCGERDLGRLLRSLSRLGVAPPRIQVVVDPPTAGRRRSTRWSAATVRALAREHPEVGPPLVLWPGRPPTGAAALGGRLPRRLVVPIGRTIAVRLDRSPGPPRPPERVPVRIRPGELGHWTDEAAGQAVAGWITPSSPQQP